ncbi:MAG: type II toxin-antitoxin system HicB family antitoxin [bacterium]
MATRTYTFPIIIEKEPEDPGYFAHSPLLPGCYSDGLTVDETRENMREAMALHLEMLIEHGDPIPSETEESVVVLEDLTVAISA